MIQLDTVIRQAESLEDEFDQILKRQICSIQEVFEYIEYCSQEMREMRKNLEKINDQLEPYNADDYDCGIVSYM
jgi:hypothetical protein